MDTSLNISSSLFPIYKAEKIVLSQGSATATSPKRQRRTVLQVSASSTLLSTEEKLLRDLVLSKEGSQRAKLCHKTRCSLRLQLGFQQDGHTAGQKHGPPAIGLPGNEQLEGWWCLFTQCISGKLFQSLRWDLENFRVGSQPARYSRISYTSNCSLHHVSWCSSFYFWTVNEELRGLRWALGSKHVYSFKSSESHNTQSLWRIPC